MYDKLFRCLGNYNPSLTNLFMYSLSSSTLQQSETVINDSLRCLSNGCPLLRQLSITNTRVSTQAVTYLVNHSSHLEILNLSFCCICDDGLTITKEADKLKYLKMLSLSFNNRITDESIINLVTGCHNLETISIFYCPKLSDTCLFTIAANCPRLKKIDLDFDDNKITKSGLQELLNKCPKLVEIYSIDVLPNEINKELLRRRKT